MKAQTLYVCEICGCKYMNEKDALGCEARGVFDASKFPFGLLTKVDLGKGQYGIFALNTPACSVRGHDATGVHWAYRSWDNFSNDIIDFSTFGLCSNRSYLDLDSLKKYSYLTPEDLKLRETKWMIRQLKGNGITPSYFNEKGELITIH